MADIVDHPQELEITGEQKPPVTLIGEVTYSGVSFRFAESSLQQKTLISVFSGSFVGVVGSSGSKSTI